MPEFDFNGELFYFVLFLFKFYFFDKNLFFLLFLFFGEDFYFKSKLKTIFFIFQNLTNGVNKNTRAHTLDLILLLLEFINVFPYLKKANRRVESVENGERHRNVGNYGPRPDSIEFEMSRIIFSFVFLKGVQ